MVKCTSGIHGPFLNPPVVKHGGLIYIAFCLSACDKKSRLDKKSPDKIHFSLRLNLDVSGRAHINFKLLHFQMCIHNGVIDKLNGSFCLFQMPGVLYEWLCQLCSTCVKTKLLSSVKYMQPSPFVTHQYICLSIVLFLLKTKVCK